MSSSNLNAETTKSRTLSLEPYLSLARELTALLVPQQPSREFRAELHRSLMASARQQQAQYLLDLPSTPPGPGGDLPGRMVEWVNAAGKPEHRWAVGAAAVSLAGILVYVLRHRSRPAASA